MSIVGSLIPWVDLQFHDTNGDPLAGGFVEFFNTGLATHKDTFSTSDLNPVGVNSNPVVLDSDGRPPVGIFLESGGYDVTISDSNSVLVNTVVGVEDIGQTLAASLGTVLMSGARNVTDGYTVIATDYFITVDGSGGPDPTNVNLPTAASRVQQIVIKNVGSTGVQVNPNGSEKLEITLASYTINAVTTPTILPTVTFGPSPTDNGYLIVSSHAQ